MKRKDLMQSQRLPFTAQMLKKWLAREKRFTRRVIIQQPEPTAYLLDYSCGVATFSSTAAPDTFFTGSTWGNRYGEVGEYVLIAETLRKSADGRFAVYASDDAFVLDGRNNVPWPYKSDVMPSIFMQKKFARYAAQIEALKFERVQEISEHDARLEGVGAWHDTVVGTTYRGEFALLWDTINGARGHTWESNPMVIAIGLSEPIKLTD